MIKWHQIVFSHLVMVSLFNVKKNDRRSSLDQMSLLSTPTPLPHTPPPTIGRTICILKGYFKTCRPLRTNFLFLPKSRGYPKTILCKLNVIKTYHLLFSVCSSEIVVLSSKEGLNTLKNYTQFKGIVSFTKRKLYNTADGANNSGKCHLQNGTS